jgi:thiamine-monophosphate kinase
VNERELVARVHELFSQRIGDDGAVVDDRVYTTDMLVEDVDFTRAAPLRLVARKSLAVNLSDLAAMGATPRWVLLAGSLPEADEAWIAAFAEGFFACAGEYGVEVVGGDTTRGPLNLCITALGEVAPGQALRRDGARAGDDIWVSGRPGLAGLGLAHRQGKVELPEPWRRLCLAALEKPRPRIALGQALVGVANAAIDVSDGLLADLGHIAERSQLAAVVQLVQLPHLPKGLDRALALDCQLAGGDDYELCFTASPEQRLAIGRIAADLELPLWCIGTLQAPGAAFTMEDWNGVAEGAGTVTVYDPDGKPVEFDRKGYEHFG